MTSPTAERISALTAAPAGIDRVVLIGFMGAGKTSVGRLLARRLGWTFLDLDTYIEARAAQTVGVLFAEHGESHFRRLESSALASALAGRQTVLALGGGTPEQLTNRLLLEQTPGTLIVHLDAPFATLYDRCMLEELSAGPKPGSTPVLKPAPDQAEPLLIRPVLASPAEAELRFRRRAPLYRRLAHLTVSTAEHDPDQAVAMLLELFSAS